MGSEATYVSGSWKGRHFADSSEEEVESSTAVTQT